MERDRDLTVAVLFDTAGFLRTLPMTGAATRTAKLNRWLHHQGALTTLLLCDLNPDSRPSGTWPLPVRYLPYETVYEHPDRLQLHLAELAPDVLVMSNTQLMVRYGRELADSTGASLIYELHDDEATLLRTIGDDTHHEAAVLQSAACTAADGVITFTDRDATTARDLGASAVQVVPCGVDLGTPPRSRSTTDDVRLVFVGNLYYEPNRRAVQYLHDVLAPALPDNTVVDVIGRYPPDLRKLAGRLRMRGPVRNLRPVLEQATLALAPLDTGAGMKLKVLDYLAAGLPVVGTGEAFVGIAQVDQWAVETTLPNMPNQVMALLHDEATRRRLGQRGRHVVEQRHCWSKHAGQARVAYEAIVDQHRTRPRATPPGAAARELAAAPPYWLREWRSHRTTPTITPEQPGHGMDDYTTGDDSIVGGLAEDIDCARLAAEAALETTFTRQSLVGYGQRSVVFLAPAAALKVYTHRWQERASREAAGLQVAAHATGLRVPEVLAHDELPGQLSWLASTRLTGTQPHQHDSPATPILGKVAARLHALPTHLVAELAEHRQRFRELPTGDTPTHQAARNLDSALGNASAAAKPRCSHGFVHGDCSSRNVLLDDDAPPGVIDFEGAGVGCSTEDLAAMVLHECLLGPRDRHLLLDSYETELHRLAPIAVTVQPEHLAFHLVVRARWIMQWAIDLDPDLADAITDLTPWLLDTLAGTETVR